jgi:hypothetical protein
MLIRAPDSIGETSAEIAQFVDLHSFCRPADPYD